MPKGIYKPNAQLLEILKQQEQSEFTVTDIRDVVVTCIDKKTDMSDARRWVNGQFKTLVKHEFLSVASKSGIRTTFKNTDKIFNDVGVVESSHTESKVLTKNQLKILELRLREYKFEMLISSAEIKEFEDLSKLWPDQRDHLQSKFNTSKEKNIEFLGRVSAIESLIADNI
jgi:hypothetical protein